MVAAARPTTPLASHFRGAERLAQVLEEPGCLWVTDADGTLWSEDIGEGFLRRLIADRALVSPAAAGDTWARYRELVAQDAATGYGWAAQLLGGLPSDEVRQRAEAFAREFVPKHGFPAMRALVAEAKAQGGETWIVSASAEPIVRAAAPLMGIDPTHVVGLRVAEEAGRLTSRLVGPVTYRQGKVEAIDRCIGRRPALVSGDSAGDVEMLSSATRLALVVRQPSSAASFLGHATAAGWLVESLATP